MKCLRILVVLLLLMSVVWVNDVIGEDIDKQIIVSDAWVKAMPPVVKHSAAYMTIENQSQQIITLVSVDSKAAEAVEIHTMEHIEGMMKMRRIENVSIPSQERVEFKSGGLHLMLIGLAQPLNEGDKVNFILNFDGGFKKEVSALIKRQTIKGSGMKGSYGKGSVHE